MGDGETLISMAHRHVHEGKLRIRKQFAILDRLAKIKGADIAAAEALLRGFQDALAEQERHLAEIIDGQRTGKRDAAGNLVRAG